MNLEERTALINQGKIDRDDVRRATWDRAEATLGLGGPRNGRATNVIVLGDNDFIVEVIGGWWKSDRSELSWHVVVNEQKANEAFPSLDLALLAAVQYRASGRINGNDKGFVYAARALSVPTEGN